ncbi:MAG: hypothetical protein Q9181_004662, partial [Wetmoreana brouardii]
GSPSRDDKNGDESALLKALDREATRMHAANHLVRARNELLESMRDQGVEKQVLLEGQWLTGPPGSGTGMLMEGTRKGRVTVAVIDRGPEGPWAKEGKGQEEGLEQGWGSFAGEEMQGGRLGIPTQQEQERGERMKLGTEGAEQAAGLGISIEQQQQQERDEVETGSASNDQGAEKEQAQLQDKGKAKEPRQILRGNENGIVRELVQAQREKEIENAKGKGKASEGFGKQDWEFPNSPWSGDSLGSMGGIGAFKIGTSGIVGAKGDERQGGGDGGADMEEVRTGDVIFGGRGDKGKGKEKKR